MLISCKLHWIIPINMRLILLRDCVTRAYKWRYKTYFWTFSQVLINESKNHYQDLLYIQLCMYPKLFFYFISNAKWRHTKSNTDAFFFLQIHGRQDKIKYIFKLLIWRLLHPIIWIEIDFHMICTWSSPTPTWIMTS